jgi:acyl-CoA synthetase (AMP-forming)/AMP-acid ligase II
MSETVIHCWRALVRAQPEATALIDGADGRRWTRAALSEAASGWLRALPADTRAALARRRVIMAEPNGARWFHVFLGLLEAGAIPAPADARETPATLHDIAAACPAAWLWHEGEFSILDSRFSIGRYRAENPLERQLHQSFQAKRHACQIENRKSKILPPRARRGDLCLVKLTSGSTGTPKALVFTHAQMLADGRQLAAAMDIRPGDLNLAVIPLGHSYGLGSLVMPLLAQGTPLLCAASPLPRALAADCERWRPAIFPAVPTLLRALAQTGIAPASLASLRVIISAGAPLAPETAAAFAQKFSRDVHAFYGTSETGGIAYDRTGRAALTTGNVGTPVAGVTLRWRRGGRFAVAGAAVHGRGTCSPPDRAETNARGELILRGRAGHFAKIAGRRVNLVEVENALRALPGVTDVFAAEHPSRPDALAAAVAITGNAAGSASVTPAGLRGMGGPSASDAGPDLAPSRGRDTRRQNIPATRNVDLPPRPDARSGPALMTLKSSKSSRAMQSRPDTRSGPTANANAGPPVTPSALRAALGPRLAAWKIPARILVLKEFPVTARGKTDRRRLTALLAETPH